ncbi:MAG: hypothetical protein DRI86_07410 [Bacteroidetes bacterium]|nr:MAG: hypothetical protein DRI86_07410 [Bacteroidota bacterium]
MNKLNIFLLAIFVCILGAVIIYSTTTREERIGCDRFRNRVQEDCVWCENNNGKYMSTGLGATCIMK